MTAKDWDADGYLSFSDERARPARDLLGRITHPGPRLVIDLGCGTGEQAAMMKRRWPPARVVGVDSSETMLEKARVTCAGDVTWVKADITTFEPPEKADVLYSNAALQWLDNHPGLFPWLIERLSDGGVFAVQMPRNFAEPSHQVMREVAQNGSWADRLRAVRAAAPVARPSDYYEILSPLVRQIDIWETTYTHVLDGDDPVAAWARTTGLRPFLNALADDEERDAFYNAYAEALRHHYPRQENGRTLFPFKRLFIVAKR